MNKSIPMKIGYARVRNKDQNLDLQITVFEKAGCVMIFKETVSGAKQQLPELVY